MIRVPVYLLPGTNFDACPGSAFSDKLVDGMVYIGVLWNSQSWQGTIPYTVPGRGPSFHRVDEIRSPWKRSDTVQGPLILDTLVGGGN